MTVLRDILVPREVVRDSVRFGGTAAGECLRGDLTFTPDGTCRLAKSTPTDAPRMVIPAPVEAHCHLDKCHSGPRLGPVGGDLSAAINAQMADKKNWTEEDLRRRMRRGLDDLMQAGCRQVRSHIDWGDDAAPPLAWHVLRETAADMPEMNIQLSPLTGIDQFADREFCFKVARHAAETPGGVLGSFVLHHEQTQAGLRNIFDAAQEYDLPVDFHVDEGLGDFHGVEHVCDAAITAGFDGPIMCGHAVALIDKAPSDLERITDKLVQTGATVCALPTTNLYLQGRRHGTPDRRGLTRLLELHAAGVPIVVASDNVDDAFCPVGQHDPRAALHLAMLAAHLDPPAAQWLPAITTHAAAALGTDPQYVDTAPASALRICAVATTADLIAGRAPLLPLSLSLVQ